MGPCGAPRSATPFRLVGVRRCRPTLLRKVGRRGRRVSTVIGGPRTPAFRGAVITLRGSNTLLSHMAAIFNGLVDTRADSRVRRLTRGVVPMLSRRDGGVDLGRGLFTHVGTMCRRGSRLRLGNRSTRLLRGACSNFMEDNTGLANRTGRGFHRLGARLDVLALHFSRGLLGRAGGCRLTLARGRLRKLPRDSLRDCTRATGSGKGRNDVVALSTPDFIPFVGCYSSHSLHERICVTCGARYARGGRCGGISVVGRLMGVHVRLTRLLNFSAFTRCGLGGHVTRADSTMCGLLGRLLSTCAPTTLGRITRIRTLTHRVRNGSFRLVP